MDFPGLGDSALYTFGLVALLGAIAAVFSVKLLSPLLMASFQATQELKDPDLLALAHRRLRDAGLPPLRVDVWPLQRYKSANAMVVGMVNVPRFFQARILLSDSLIQNFSRQELDAILAHEVAHFQQNHLSKRIWIPFGIYSFIVLTGSAIASGLLLLLLVPLLGAVAYVVCFSFLLRYIVRAQELDADWIAIHRFGVDKELYFRTLERMANYQPLDRQQTQGRSSHPSTEERKRQTLASSESPRPPFERAVIATLRYPAMALIFVALLSMWLGKSTQPPAGREPAAVEKKNP